MDGGVEGGGGSFYWMMLGTHRGAAMQATKFVVFCVWPGIVKENAGKMGGEKSGLGANGCRRSQTSLIYKHGSDCSEESDHRKKYSLLHCSKVATA